MIKRMMYLLLLIFFATASHASFAVNTQTVCAGTSIAGWMISNETWSPTSCGNVTPASGNVWTLSEYDNLPVGASLAVCTVAGNLPGGWTVSGFTTSPSSCGAQYAIIPPTGNVMTMFHQSCQNEAQNLCYPQPPPSPTGTLTASPITVYVPYGQSESTTTLAWTTHNLSGSECIWVSEDGGAAGSMNCSTGSSGSIAVPWIVSGHHYVFTLYQQTGQIQLATVTVNGVAAAAPSMTATPNPVTIPISQTSSNYTLTWNAPGYSLLDLYATTNTITNVLCLGQLSGTTGSITSPGINRSEVEHLYIVPSTGCVGGASYAAVPNPVLANLIVTTVTPTLVASPNPVTVPAGQTSANYSLTWYSPGYTSLDVYVTTSASASPVCLGQWTGVSGTISNAGITRGEVEHIFVAPAAGCHAGTTYPSLPLTILATVTVTANN